MRLKYVDKAWLGQTSGVISSTSTSTSNGGDPASDLVDAATNAAPAQLLWYILHLPQKLLTDSVDADHNTALHHAMASTPYEANRTIALLSKMFSLAEKWGLRPDASNPCHHVEKYKEHARKR